MNFDERKIISNEIDSIEYIKEIETQYSDPYDSLRNLIIDTTTLRGKREYIMNHFLIDYSPSAPDFDSLFDINFDGNKDYIIGYYAQAGTGIKNRIDVYLYNNISKCYIYDNLLSGISNPTFYLNQKIITGFYIGYGGGNGKKIEWINDKWTITKEFNVSNEEEKTIWYINYPLNNKKEKIKRDYSMIPPSDILETNVTY